MNEVFEKIINRMEDYMLYEDEMGYPVHTTSEKQRIYKCMEIVKEVAEEYNNGWIPCSERLPEEHETMFAKLKGTDCWNNAMPEKMSYDVNVTVKFEDGKRTTMTMHTTDGKWNQVFDIVKKEVIAWQPLPEPFMDDKNE